MIAAGIGRERAAQVPAGGADDGVRLGGVAKRTYLCRVGNSVLHIRDLSTGYRSGGRRRVVSAGLCGSLPSASLTALVGPNGTGKSTLLRTLAGLQPPLGGSVSWMGRPLAGYTPRELARTLAVVLTSRPDADGLTARDTVAMGRMPYTGFGGRLSAHDREIVAEALDETEASALADRCLNDLSDGERARVMVAKALAQQTPVILLDEPTAFLDFPGRIGMLRLLRRLADRHGKTILLSTHDLELTFRTVGHLWLLSAEGLLEGPPRRLAEDGSIGRLFRADGTRFDSHTLRFSLSSDHSSQSLP